MISGPVEPPSLILIVRLYPHALFTRSLEENHLEGLKMAPRIPVIKKNVGFPVYALAWQSDDVMIASGGGGVGNFGVKNKIVHSLPSQCH
jgi:hypothetical protein